MKLVISYTEKSKVAICNIIYLFAFACNYQSFSLEEFHKNCKVDIEKRKLLILIVYRLSGVPKKETNEIYKLTYERYMVFRYFDQV